jgi:hypothetical protein
MAQWDFAEYRDFYDVPRIILARCDLGTFLFNSRFDDIEDKYSDYYEVYQLSPVSAKDVSGSWVGIESCTMKHLGQIGIGDFPFDVAGRKFLDYDSLWPLLQLAGSLAADPSSVGLSDREANGFGEPRSG